METRKSMIAYCQKFGVNASTKDSTVRLKKKYENLVAEKSATGRKNIFAQSKTERNQKKRLRKKRRK